MESKTQTSDRTLAGVHLLGEFDVLVAHFDHLRCEEFAIASKSNQAALVRARKLLSEIARECVTVRKALFVRSGQIAKERQGNKEEDEKMEKYGVDEGGSEKTAEDENKKEATKITCPKCGAEVQIHGNVKICPNCGSEAFEQP